MTRGYLVHHYLEHSAAARPEAIAVVDGERTLTYAELDERAGRVANLLADLGVRRGDRVGIYLRKSAEAVVAIYGALKAGACYVPLDPSAPSGRIGYIAGDCGIEVILSGNEKRRAWGDLREGGAGSLRTVVVLNAPGDGLPELDGVAVLGVEAVDERDPNVADGGAIDQDLAYILYTSGSTGTPKGVMLSHRACRAFVDWAAEEYSVGPADVVSSHAPLHFDLSTFDLYAASRAGAKLVLVPPKISVFPVEVARFIETHRITVWYSVPSILTMLVDRAELPPDALPSIRVLLFAGEVFPTKYLSRLMRLMPGRTFANLYGPTETNVCTAYTVPEPPDEADPPVSIGRAIANVETFVVDEEGDEVELGEVGELLVRGPTVMRGYWGDEERTAARLVRDPRDPVFGDPVYHTGDLVQETDDGNYRFLGRRDNQIKSRGYRIELGDIESAVNSHPDVVECVVVAVPDEFVTNRIRAFVATSAEVGEATLTAHCAGLIPKYMVPEAFYFRPHLPKTSTGKLDRKRLTDEAVAVRAEQPA